ncbi:protein phosphatase 2C domain-containing protein [Streptomyces sp. WMMB303]|uniref:protein phosphatase 2C domain-containing protein n=1 Tax=Streptomyces sp. WMMB303 TaxID=3034154 RepID=UPI0023EC11F4|nr:protein phosphatase 2C domain-containing protein [Streptomyces sp. WMMB303]MDF4252936.1 protein phosphatase 2C domain-containing protein [Streptomyces sp. WMMB303]
MIVAGAGVQGTGHLATGRGCQDAFRAADLGDAVVLAVADGAGGRERSALGAHLAVDTACRVLAEGVPGTDEPPGVWTGWAAACGTRLVADHLRAAEGILRAAGPPALSGQAGPEEPGGLPRALQEPSAPPVDTGALAATVAAAVLRPPWVVFVAVGDCFGTVLTRGTTDPGPPPGSGGLPIESPGPTPGPGGPPPEAAERCHLVLPPPGPGGPGPVFLSSPGAALRVRSFAVWEPELTGVVLATDGCTALTLDHPSARALPPQAGPLPSERFFCGLASTLRANGGDAEPLRALLSGPEAARTGDDLTVLCALTGGW